MQQYGFWIAILTLTACSNDFEGTEKDPTQSPGEASSEEPTDDPAEDIDGDGFTVEQGDCDDEDENVYPGADDIPGNGVDEDCDGQDASGDDDIDNDNDGFTENQGDCDDFNDTIYPNAPEIPDNGIDEDCDGQDETTPQNMLAQLPEGALIITEIMNNPYAVDDELGEWFEIYNNAGMEVNLNGLEIGDATNIEYTIQQDLNIPTNGYLVLGNNADSTTNGGIAIDYQYSDITLGNSGDEIVLSYGTTIFDMVDYDGDFPDPNGASISLSMDSFSDTANDDGSNWCQAFTQLDSGDYGTPGAANDDCDLIVPNDNDGDGYSDVNFGGNDCNDADPTINPGAVDFDNDGIDQNCDGTDLTTGLCNDTCDWPSDGACDDGGPNADYSLCDFGTDCSDCGERLDMDQDGYYDDEGTTPLNTDLLMDCDDGDSTVNPDGIEVADDGIDQDCSGDDLVSLCDDSCIYANDGACDDGGLNSEYSLCDLGTDCTDCGSRFDIDEDGFDSDYDCDDNDPNIYPGVNCDSCDGIDDDNDGTIDEDYDTTEPTDSSSPIYIGSLEDGTLSTNGFLTHSADQDAFTLYSDDGWFTTPDFTCAVSAPANVDIALTLNDPFGFTYTTSSTGLGATAFISFSGTGGTDDSGNYTLILDAASGQSCDGYLITCYYD